MNRVTTLISLLTTLCSLALEVVGQVKQPSQQVIEVNRLTEESVVAKNIESLKKIYAEDFVFTHATDLVDSKESWLKTVSSPDRSYIQRRPDSTAVEMHGDLAIVTGSLSIVRSEGGTRSSYGIRYVRVFVYRQKRWQMISHRTTKEWRE